MKLNAIAAKNELFKPPIMKIMPVMTANSEKRIPIRDNF